MEEDKKKTKIVFEEEFGRVVFDTASSPVQAIVEEIADLNEKAIKIQTRHALEQSLIVDSFTSAMVMNMVKLILYSETKPLGTHTSVEGFDLEQGYALRKASKLINDMLPLIERKLLDKIEGYYRAYLPTVMEAELRAKEKP